MTKIRFRVLLVVLIAVVLTPVAVVSVQAAIALLGGAIVAAAFGIVLALMLGGAFVVPFDWRWFIYGD